LGINGLGMANLQREMGQSTQSSILSMTIPQILVSRDPEFLHHDERVAELAPPLLDQVFASTLLFQQQSSKFDENGAYYVIYIMFVDFWETVKSGGNLKEEIRQRIQNNDVLVSCDCAANQYWGYSYLESQLDYIYPGYEESRFPKVRNPGLRGSVCKHISNVLKWISDPKNLDSIVSAFNLYSSTMPKLNVPEFSGGNIAPLNSIGAPSETLPTQQLPPEAQMPSPEDIEQPEQGEWSIDTDFFEEDTVQELPITPASSPAAESASTSGSESATSDDTSSSGQGLLKRMMKYRESMFGPQPLDIDVSPSDEKPWF
jgi:hypothetical protein